MANCRDDAATKSPAELIDARIKELGDWRGEMLARFRRLIKAADPGVVDEWKWRDGNSRRAIDLHEGDEIDEKALTALIRATVSLNDA
ncbi:DUF1801 domain-containing protein [Mycobacterium colombiense]